MDDLIIRVLNGQATPSEEERLRRWRAESRENQARFVQTQRVWALTGPVGRTEYSTPPGVEVITGADEGPVEEQAGVVPLAARRAERGRGSWNVRGMLAAAAAVAAVAVGIRFVGGPGPVAEPTATFAAVDGAVLTVTLDDGSLARLAPGSRLQEWAGDGQRRFSLQGRAFFAVRHEPARPFVVEVGSSEARVLGTRFELSGGAGTLRTVVVDGRVAVSNGAGRVEVPAGSVSDAGDDAAPSVRSVDDVYALLDWPGGLLVFQGTPLHRAAEDVARHFGRSVEVRGDLAERRVTAFFEEEGFEEVVQALCEVSGAFCSLTDSGALLRDPSADRGGRPPIP